MALSVYINGVEVARSNLPGILGDGTINTNTPGSSNVLGRDEENYFLFSDQPFAVSEPVARRPECHRR